MSGAEWAAMIGAVAGMLTPIGLAFGWLIRLIVDQSKEAVTELEEKVAKLEADRDAWRDRALSLGWKGDAPP